MKKKKPGIERPYTFSEFHGLIYKLAKEQNIEYIDKLEYFSVSETNEEITSSDFTVRSETYFGDGEGIYTRFTIKLATIERSLFIAKTLWESDEDFIQMHIFAAKIYLLIKKYLQKNEDEFNWKGYNVDYTQNGKKIPCWWCASKNNAIARANELKDKGYKPIIRENSTRKFIEI